MTTIRPPGLRVATFALPVALILSLTACAHAPASGGFTFDSGRPGAARTEVMPGMAYNAARGFGYEAGAQGAGQPFFFSSDLEEGNYNVSITFGHAQAAASTTVRAELRRLMLESVKTLPGQFVTRTFTVNVRTPQIKARGDIAAGVVKLKEPRESVGEARSWDRRLTLEFTGVNPSVRAITIAPVLAPTLFLLGDSTVCDQGDEPYASWGQMLPRFLKSGIGVANLGQSGETYRESISRRRLDKILSVMQPGDTVLMQYGHNDQKQIKDGKGGPFTTYKAEIRTHVAGVRAYGGVPVIISPMERRKFDEQGKVVPSLIDYADAARQVALELKVAFIDLNAMSKPFYEALGAEQSKFAFAEPRPGHTDNTHHNNYGSYQLARAVVSGIRANRLPVAAFMADDMAPFDPSRPDPVASFALPASPGFTTVRPLGDEANK